MLRYCFVFGLLSVLVGCESVGISQQNFIKLPTVGEKGVNAVIEIPAGTNHKIEFNEKTATFEVDQLNGKERIIDFLPYPGNYGFIPSTKMDEARGGDGDALDVLVLAESLASQTVIEVHPIGALMLLDDGELDTKIIAIPVDTSLRIIQAEKYADFMIQYDVARRMIQDWFLTYKGTGRTELIGWQDERAAINEIKKWLVE